MLTSLMLMSAAYAQVAGGTVTGGDVPELNAQAFRPSIDSRPYFWITDTALLKEGTPSFRGTLSYTKDPLVYYSADETVDPTTLVGGITQLDLAAGYVTGPARLGLLVPVYLRAGGLSSSDTTGEQIGVTGLGDLMADLKIQALNRDEDAIGLAISGRTSMPTATTDLALATSGLLYEIEGGLDKPLGNLLLSLNLGHRGQPKVELENATWGSQLYGRLGGAYAFNPNVGVGVELNTSATYADLGNSAVMPTEALFGLWNRRESGLALHGGFGIGIGNAVSTPKFRVLFTAAYDPMGAKDKDLDGILDKDDACPTVPEDKDSVKDADGCPEATIVTVVVVDQFGDSVKGATWTQGDKSGSPGNSLELFGGSYTFGAKADGYKPGETTVAIPDAENYEVKIVAPMIMGSLKVLAKDTAGKSIDTAQWRLAERGINKYNPAGETVELKPGDYTILAEAEGYKGIKRPVTVIADKVEEIMFEMVPAKAVMKKDKIEIREVVYFETNKAIIKPESFALLDEVAEIMKDHPELTKIRVEGHTDSRGNNTANKTLSQNRANSVRDYLVNKGVETTRLEAVGWGEEKLLVTPEKTDADRSKNRRVEFFVAERSDNNVEGELKVIDIKDDTIKPDEKK